MGMFVAWIRVVVVVDAVKNDRITLKGDPSRFVAGIDLLCKRKR